MSEEAYRTEIATRKYFEDKPLHEYDEWYVWRNGWAKTRNARNADGNERNERSTKRRPKRSSKRFPYERRSSWRTNDGKTNARRPNARCPNARCPYARTTNAKTSNARTPYARPTNANAPRYALSRNANEATNAIRANS
jgi:hypothetical protein